jgi:hypothetical protein
MVRHERNHLTADLQRGHIAVEVDSIQRLDLQPNVPVYQLTDRHHDHPALESQSLPSKRLGGQRRSLIRSSSERP